jgi:Uma2 family endonuclease
MFAKVDAPITVEEFDSLGLPEDREWELQDGEVVGMTFPNFWHRRLQQRGVNVLQPLFPTHEVMMECPFQVGNLDKRAADIGVVERSRAKKVDGKGVLQGAPDFVIEVLSPSNSLTALKAYRRLCFANGTELFWIMDPEENTVEAYLKGEKQSRIWSVGEDAPIALFGLQVAVPVIDFFRDITL